MTSCCEIAATLGRNFPSNSNNCTSEYRGAGIRYVSNYVCCDIEDALCVVRESRFTPSHCNANIYASRRSRAILPVFVVAPPFLSFSLEWRWYIECDVGESFQRVLNEEKPAKIYIYISLIRGIAVYSQSDRDQRRLHRSCGSNF